MNYSNAMSAALERQVNNSNTVDMTFHMSLSIVNNVNILGYSPLCGYFLVASFLVSPLITKPSIRLDLVMPFVSTPP